MNLKKGLSPLISFILIIAFTVATASLLYNLALDLFSEASTCETVSLEEMRICHTNNNNDVVVGVRNLGTNVDSLFVKINGDTFITELDNSFLRRNTRLEETIAFRGTVRSVEVIPVASGELCEYSLMVRNIPRC